MPLIELFSRLTLFLDVAELDDVRFISHIRFMINDVSRETTLMGFTWFLFRCVRSPGHPMVDNLVQVTR